ncbi:hypothetical protein GCM10010428_53130 [Actinosynnema pretiosum subsp. pretiosum]
MSTPKALPSTAALVVNTSRPRDSNRMSGDGRRAGAVRDRTADRTVPWEEAVSYHGRSGRGKSTRGRASGPRAFRQAPRFSRLARSRDERRALA